MGTGTFEQHRLLLQQRNRLTEVPDAVGAAELAPQSQHPGDRRRRSPPPSQGELLVQQGPRRLVLAHRRERGSLLAPPRTPHGVADRGHRVLHPRQRLERLLRPALGQQHGRLGLTEEPDAVTEAIVLADRLELGPGGLDSTLVQKHTDQERVDVLLADFRGAPALALLGCGEEGLVGLSQVSASPLDEASPQVRAQRGEQAAAGVRVGEGLGPEGHRVLAAHLQRDSRDDPEESGVDLLEHAVGDRELRELDGS